jgi:hypothetical protein
MIDVKLPHFHSLAFIAIPAKEIQDRVYYVASIKLAPRPSQYLPRHAAGTSHMKARISAPIPYTIALII